MFLIWQMEQSETKELKQNLSLTEVRVLLSEKAELNCRRPSDSVTCLASQTWANRNGLFLFIFVALTVSYFNYRNVPDCSKSQSYFHNSSGNYRYVVTLHFFMLNSKCYAVTTQPTGTCLHIVLWCHADVDILNCCRNIFVLSACLLIDCGKEQLITELHSKFVSQTTSPSVDVWWPERLNDQISENITQDFCIHFIKRD